MQHLKLIRSIFPNCELGLSHDIGILYHIVTQAFSAAVVLSFLRHERSEILKFGASIYIIRLHIP